MIKIMLKDLKTGELFCLKPEFDGLLYKIHPRLSSNGLTYFYHVTSRPRYFISLPSSTYVYLYE